jgi:hypothetical protein
MCPGTPGTGRLEGRKGQNRKEKKTEGRQHESEHMVMFDNNIILLGLFSRHLV